MKDKTTGKLAWHVHDNVLCEVLLDSLDERIKYLKGSESAFKIERRLRLMKLVKGPLPEDLESALIEYYAIESDRRASRVKWVYALLNWGRILNEEYESFILDLHDKECPNCPWDGNTIFPEGVEDER